MLKCYGLTRMGVLNLDKCLGDWTRTVHLYKTRQMEQQPSSVQDGISEHSPCTEDAGRAGEEAGAKVHRCMGQNSDEGNTAYRGSDEDHDFAISDKHRQEMLAVGA